MRNIIFERIILFMIFPIIFASCKDEIDPPPPPPPPPPVGYDTALTRFYSDKNTMGVYVGRTSPEAALDQMSNTDYQETLKRDSAIACALQYHAKYIRLNLFKDLWDDQTPMGGREFFLDYYRAVKDAGILPVLNVNYHRSDYSTPEPFPDPAIYSSYLTEVLDSLNAIQFKPAIIIVENEEANFTQYAIDTSDDTRMYADLQRYVDQLAGAIAVGSNYTWWDGSRGVEVTNGGLMTRSITFVAWDWLNNTVKDKGLTEYYETHAFGPTMYRQVNKVPLLSFIDKRIKINKYLESKLNALPMKYINIHWTEPIATRAWEVDREGGYPEDFGISEDSIGRSVLDLTVLYYHKTMPGKKLMSNEISQLTYSPILMQLLINKVIEHPFGAWDIVTFYDADNNDLYGSKGLHNTLPTVGGFQFTYVLRDNGVVLEQNLKNLK